MPTTTWMLMASTVVLWGLWAVSEKTALKHTSPLMVQLVVLYVYSALAPLLFLYMKSTKVAMEWTSLGIFWSTITCLLAFASGMTFIHALQRAPTYLVVGFTSIYPLATLLFCVLFLGEHVTLTKIIGIVVIITGTVILGL
jgi:transporter family protein